MSGCLVLGRQETCLLLLSLQKKRLGSGLMVSGIDLKDTLNAFNNFKNKQNSAWSNVYIYFESVLSTLYTETKHKCKKISFGQNKQYKKCLLFSFTSSNSSQFHFQFEILIWAEAHFIVQGFHFSILFIFIKVYIFVQENACTLWNY